MGNGVRPGLVIALLTLAVAVVALLYGEGLLTPSTSSSRSESPPLQAPSTASPTPRPIETSSPSTASAAPTTPSDGSGSAVLAPPQYFHKMRTVDTIGGWRGFLYTGSYSTNGQLYPHSLAFYNSCNNTDGGDVWAEYNLGPTYKQFTATVGFSDEDPVDATGTFTVVADGAKVSSGNLKPGMPILVSIKVTGVLRLRLIANNPRAAQSCARKSHPTTTVWGDALVS